MGLCITPDFVPTEQEDAELKTPYYTSIIYRITDINRLLALKKPLILRLNNQCLEVGANFEGWDGVVHSICSTYGPDKIPVIVAGNEFDWYWNKNGSVPPEFGADLARRTARIAHNFGIKASTTSVAGPRWQEYLEIMANLCRNDVDYFDCHFYGQRPEGWRTAPWMHGELKWCLERASELAQKPIICTEEGVKFDDARTNSVDAGEQVAKFMTAAHKTMEDFGVQYKCWFAYEDRVGAPEEQGGQAFGMTDALKNRRPAWNAFKALNSGVIVPPTTPPTNPNPNPELDKWRDRVGKGLLDMMAVDQTVPAMASEWRPFDRPSGTPATIEQCIAINNVTYCYNLNTGSGWRIRPS
jgi:hypothetical protein